MNTIRLNSIGIDATPAAGGEITEIKSQSKEVEVTANGTMDITPDAGFSYLNSVKVKTNVPTSGEGSGSASSWRYFDISKATDNGSVNSAHIVKAKNYGITAIFPPLSLDYFGGKEVAVGFGIDMNAWYVEPGTNTLVRFGDTLGDAISEWIDSGVTEITEEEFCTL